jgi:hypothetical protein
MAIRLSMTKIKWYRNPKHLLYVAVIIILGWIGNFLFIDELDKDRTIAITHSNNVASHDSSKLDVNNPTITQNNTVQGTQNNEIIGRDKINNTTVKQAPKNYYDQRVSSTNAQPGSVTAHTVVIPEDKEINVVDNYEFEITENGVFIRPKHGIWQQTFAAVPSDEQAGVQFDLSSGSGTYMNYRSGTRMINGIHCRFISIGMPQASRYIKYLVSFKNKPSVIFFGDISDLEKTYSIKP